MFTNLSRNMPSSTEINNDATKLNKRKASPYPSSNLKRTREELKSINENRVQWIEQLDDLEEPIISPITFNNLASNSTNDANSSEITKKKNAYQIKLEKKLEPIQPCLASLPEQLLAMQVKAFTKSILSTKISLNNKRKTMAATASKDIVNSTHYGFKLTAPKQLMETKSWKNLNSKLGTYISEIQNTIKNDYILESHRLGINLATKQHQDTFFTELYETLSVFAHYYKILTENKKPHSLTDKQTAQLVIESIIEDFAESSPPEKKNEEATKTVISIDEEETIDTEAESTNNPSTQPNQVNNPSVDMSSLTTDESPRTTPTKLSEAQFNTKRTLDWLEVSSVTEAATIFANQSFYKNIEDSIVYDSESESAKANSDLVCLIKNSIYPTIFNEVTWKLMDSEDNTNQHTKASLALKAMMKNKKKTSIAEKTNEITAAEQTINAPTVSSMIDKKVDKKIQKITQKMEQKNSTGSRKNQSTKAQNFNGQSQTKFVQGQTVNPTNTHTINLPDGKKWTPPATKSKIPNKHPQSFHPTNQGQKIWSPNLRSSHQMGRGRGRGRGRGSRGRWNRGGRFGNSRN